MFQPSPLQTADDNFRKCRMLVLPPPLCCVASYASLSYNENIRSGIMIINIFTPDSLIGILRLLRPQGRSW